MASKLITATDAILARLRLAFPEHLFQLSLLPPAPKKRDMDTIVTRKPFLGLAWTGMTIENSRLLKGSAKWALILVAQNQRSVDERLKGDALGIGLFGMVSAAAGILHGYSLSEHGALAVTSADGALIEDWGDDSLAIAALDLTMPLILDVDPADDPQDYLRLGVTWNLPGPPGQGEPSYQINVRTS
jgi:hypothetical protein